MYYPQRYLKPFITSFFFWNIVTTVLISPSYAEDLAVHEWGTITSKHGEDGYVYGYLNHIREEETLPDFVHRLDSSMLELKGFRKVFGPSSRSCSSQCLV